MEPILDIKTSFQIYSYTRGTKKLIRNATASDYYEGSVSNIDAKGDKKLSPKEQQEKKVWNQCDQKKSQNVYKSCPKMISLEKWKILHIYKKCLRIWEIWSN